MTVSVFLGSPGMKIPATKVVVLDNVGSVARKADSELSLRSKTSVLDRAEGKAPTAATARSENSLMSSISYQRLYIDASLELSSSSDQGRIYSRAIRKWLGIDFGSSPET
jgi:hypothetical protein